MDSYDYGGSHVSRSAEWVSKLETQERQWLVPVGVQMPETQENRWYSFCLKANRLKTQEKQCFSVWVQRQEKANAPVHGQWVRKEFSPNKGKVSFFVLFRPSTDWMRPTPIKESNLLHTVGQFKWQSYPKRSDRNTQKNVWPSLWAPRGPANLTRKINHHLINDLVGEKQHK